ncbi:hypothetical protein PFICI_02859 [Pestalotiopsis fici W106-1]|uniref:Thioesterase domain-containing protein n=1 Tax=Pestalotiopsis fici (strain W106-1 / CGMCC3.15140) TaxID=1229662 RepID=W3XFQ1_PESFW|nr:uncharacterized protein PFICI_02859 [Pestalotiopsis fici W106-1]ETS84834.1 hypothetical protein PFICI_02859 [Pestalotiopsis fici W106-1]
MVSSTPLGTAESRSAAYFEAIPWCAARLRSASDPVTYWPVPWDRDGATKFGDRFFSTTLSTELTIPHFVFFHATPDPSTPENALLPELQAFLHLESGIGGYPGYAHGGFVCTVLDEITGLICTLNRTRGALFRGPAMTGYLNTRFLKPVKAPGLVLARARITKYEGRKAWVRGWLEDETGTVLAEGEAVFINLKNRL